MWSKTSSHPLLQAQRSLPCTRLMQKSFCRTSLTRPAFSLTTHRECVCNGSLRIISLKTPDTSPDVLTVCLFVWRTADVHMLRELVIFPPVVNGLHPVKTSCERGLENLQNYTPKRKLQILCCRDTCVSRIFNKFNKLVVVIARTRFQQTTKIIQCT